ncbi:MAG: AI-2E family transporter, partial [Deltaproteobacteria bacterium]|nr:AI-2E family transporter [Deltaproteobacteria bacterium]
MLEFLGHRGRIFVILILLATLLAIVLFLNKILFPFLLASFLAYVLAPVIDNLHHRKIRSYSISRGFAVLQVYFVILLVLIGGGSYVVPNVSAEMGHMIQELPKAVTKVSKEWGPVFDEKMRDLTSLFPEPEHPEPLPVIENIEPQSETTESQKENGELLNILDGYTYEIRGLDSDRIEVVPHRKVGRESGVEENQQVPLDINTQISIIAEEGMNRLKADMVRFLGLGRKLIEKVVGSVFTLFLTFMVAAFILVDTERILSFWRSLVSKKYHTRYNDLLKSLDKGLNGVVRGQLIICLINGILTFVG